MTNMTITKVKVVVTTVFGVFHGEYITNSCKGLMFEEYDLETVCTVNEEGLWYMGELAIYTDDIIKVELLFK